ncbi:hypothetical protein [Xanthomonas sacchari]|uniref:hypothetical protein n=1 Tax=Xanthomonas sacchari TaxID=56458 RepID=UPI002251D306|nr:hypothetical protein [Xanthomonas sacchari]MCW0373825.1 hypothetical protein [Xanthomonas sacchari]
MDFPKILVKREDLKDYFDWIKSLITICSAAVGALLYKYDADAARPIKISATAFGIALVAFCFCFVGFIEHKHSPDDNLNALMKIYLVIGMTSFLTGFAALVFQLY